MQSELSAGSKYHIAPESSSTATVNFDLQKKPRVGECIIRACLTLCGVLSILTTIGIIFVLVREALLFFQLPEVSVLDFISKVKWQPAVGEFGIWPLLAATLITSFIAMLVALPVGLMIAIYLSEYASTRTRNFIKPALEVLAGIPTVVFGYFALTFMTPLLRSIFGQDTIEIYNTVSAGIVIGILILPFVTSMAGDALDAVPLSLREAAYGLGATKFETATKMVVPSALSGISAAFIVAMSRAVGETMVVAMAAGSGPRNFDSWGDALRGAAILNPLKAAETMTGHIVRISGGDLSYNSVNYASLFAIGLVLFLITMALNIVSRWIVSRFHQQYE